MSKEIVVLISLAIVRVLGGVYEFSLKVNWNTIDQERDK